MNIRAASSLIATFLSASAFAVNFPSAGGDIAVDDATGWNGNLAAAQTKAGFSNNGTYTASKDVTLGEFVVSANATFDFKGSGNHVVKIPCFKIGYHGKTATVKGGVLDLQGQGGIWSGNDLGVRVATMVLSQGTVVTNATILYCGYTTWDDKFKITDGSRVYADSCVVAVNPSGVRALLEVSSGGELHVLKNNFIDTSCLKATDLVTADTTNRIVVTGTGSKIVCPATIESSNKIGFALGQAYGRNSLTVSDGGEVVAPYRFAVGWAPTAHRNAAVFDTNSKFNLSDLRIGEYGSQSNRLEILNGSTGTFSTGYLGGQKAASSDNVFVISNADVTCRQLFVSRVEGSTNNVFYVAGEDTCFTTTVRDLPRYPFVYAGSHNAFVLDGATWNYWLNMETDHGASSNRIDFVNGATMRLGGGLFGGTNDVRSVGNRLTVANGSLLEVSFFSLTCADNVLVVSNATLSALDADGKGKYGYITFGALPLYVREETVADNGLVLRGDSPTIRADGSVEFKRQSFVRFELPSTGYGDAFVPIKAKTFSVDGTSSLSVAGAAVVQRGLEDCRTVKLVNTTDGVTVPDNILAAANAALAAETGNKARLKISADGKDLLLRLSGNRGLVLILR